MSNKVNPHQAPPTTGKDVDLGEVYTRTELFIENNKKAITIGVLGILAVVGGLLGYKKLIAEPAAKEAAEMMWKAEYYFEIDSLNKALNGDDQWPGFLTIAEEHGSTPSGKLAQYYLGAIYMEQGDYEAALDHYKKADLKDDVLRVMAVGNQGDALVELGRTDEAVRQFEKAASMTNNELVAPLFLMKAGILHQQAANWKEAAKAFNRIAKEFPTSQEANTARKYAGHAEAMGG
jgi:tetratricopeptide (TPR) repeat protein